MPFNDYSYSDFDGFIEKAAVGMSLLLGAITMVWLATHQVDWMLSTRAGVSVALFIFAPIFTWCLTESSRFSITVLAILAAISWPTVWFEVLDHMASPGPRGQFWLEVTGYPWWDTVAFKTAIEAGFLAILIGCIWPYRETIARLVLAPFSLVWDAVRRYLRRPME